ncbi:glycosyl hydrolase catalytic core-domain-containing protein [Lyophyllum atratum]|nr:glycosyl hydrolase catalytic core-domain-containing protein [Lyophyllum atratum]
MVCKNNLRTCFAVFLATWEVVAAKHGLRAHRLSHHQHFAHHPHSIPDADSSLTTPLHVPTILPNSHPGTQTSRLTPSTSQTYPHITPSNHALSGSDISKATATTLRTTTSMSPLTPNGIKAGIAGGDAYPFFKDHIGWWYDWTPNPMKSGKPVGIPMLWGGGTADATDAARLAAFKKISTPPTYVLAYEEPDCPPGSGSAGMSVSSGVAGWESLIVPLGKKGSIMVSPSMCKQADETWLAQFKSKISMEWDITSIHINKNNLAGVKKDIEHYWNTYKKPIWVTEFACVNDKDGFTPCTNQDEINAYINDIVPYLQSHERVYAYAYSNGLGLGNVWPLMHGGSLSASGKTYLAAISKYH